MTILGETFEFLHTFGVFDFILPFLLVFAVVFGILEKTRILGEEEIDGVKYPKKNLDAIVAFVVGMLVVGATKVVGVINDALPRIAVLLVVSLSFLMMIGIFISPGGVYEKLEKKWLAFLMILMFIAVVLIFLSVIPANGVSWLEYGIGVAIDYWDTAIAGALILLGVVIWTIYYITQPVKVKNKEKG